MKKTLLLFAWLLTASAVQAQRMQSDPVEPASKGVLPEMPVLKQADEGHFGGLRLNYTTLLPFQGANWDYEAELSFPLPTSLGGNSYTLQIKRSGNSWETYNGDNTITGASYIVYSLSCSYRLVLHGGDKDGWVSNEVNVPYISIPSQKKSTQYNANLKLSWAVRCAALRLRFACTTTIPISVTTPTTRTTRALSALGTEGTPTQER